MKDYIGTMRAHFPANDADEAETLLRAIMRQMNKLLVHLEVEIKVDGIYECQSLTPNENVPQQDEDEDDIFTLEDLSYQWTGTTDAY